VDRAPRLAAPSESAFGVLALRSDGRLGLQGPWGPGSRWGHWGGRRRGLALRAWRAPSGSTAMETRAAAPPRSTRRASRSAASLRSARRARRRGTHSPRPRPVALASHRALGRLALLGAPRRPPLASHRSAPLRFAARCASLRAPALPS